MGYDNTNSGVLFSNKKREKDTHPTHTGQINVDGVDYWLSAWVKEKDGQRYFSLAVKPKEARQEAPASRNARVDLDDDIPF